MLLERLSQLLEMQKGKILKTLIFSAKERERQREKEKHREIQRNIRRYRESENVLLSDIYRQSLT
jgi:hypothetical protein